MSRYGDISTMLIMSGIADDDDERGRLSMALWEMNRYVDGAAAQMHRMWSEHAATPGQIITDAHFYFLCWDIIAQMTRVLLTCSALPTVRKVWQEVGDEVNRYRVARGLLDYRDEAVMIATIGGQGGVTMQSPFAHLAGMFLSRYLQGHILWIGDAQWNVGPESLTRLQAITDRIFQAVLDDIDHP